MASLIAELFAALASAALPVVATSSDKSFWDLFVKLYEHMFVVMLVIVAVFLSLIALAVMLGGIIFAIWWVCDKLRN